MGAAVDDTIFVVVFINFVVVLKDTDVVGVWVVILVGVGDVVLT